jgi:hypothetical protein
MGNLLFGGAMVGPTIPMSSDMDMLYSFNLYTKRIFDFKDTSKLDEIEFEYLFDNIIEPYPTPAGVTMSFMMYRATKEMKMNKTATMDIMRATKHFVWAVRHVQDDKYLDMLLEDLMHVMIVPYLDEFREMALLARTPAFLIWGVKVIKLAMVMRMKEEDMKLVLDGLWKHAFGIADLLFDDEL